MEIKVMTDRDREFVMSIDKHVDDTGYANRVYTKSGYVIWEKDQRIGIIVHCILWDHLHESYLHQRRVPQKRIRETGDPSLGRGNETAGL